MKENKKYSLLELDIREPITPFLYKLIPVNPDDIIDVEVASGAEAFLSKEDQRKFINPDFLVKSACVALKSDITSNAPGKDHFFSYPEEGRSLPVFFGKVKYAESFVGSFISVKGSGLTGYVPYLSQQSLNQDYVRAAFKNQIPHGLYGRESALEDIKYAMTLLNNGIKTALPLGFIVLRRDTIARYNKLYTQNKPMQELSRIAFQYIDTHDDDPVLYFRLSGTRRRLHFAGNYDKTKQSLSFHKSTERLSLWQGVQLLAQELASAQARTTDSLNNTELSASELKYLQTAAKPDDQTRKITYKLVLAYQNYLTHRLELLENSANPLLQKFMSFVNIPNYGDNSILKDFDTSLCWYDFEGLDQRSLSQSQKPSSLVVAEIINKYLGLLKTQQLIPQESYTHSAI